MFYPFKNIFAQEPFSHSSTGSYNGWLYHPYKVTVGGYIEPRHTLLVYSDKMVSLGGGQIGPHPSKNNGGSKSFDLNNKGGIEGLTIKQNVGLNSLQVANATTGHTETDGILLGNKGNIGFINQQENANLEFYTNNQRRATITNQGRVLIGEATPQAQLNIKTITNGINLVSQGSSMNYGLRIGIQTSKNAILVNNKFTVKGDGRVGIGVANPLTAIHIKGNTTQEIKLEGTDQSSLLRLIAVTSNNRTESQIRYKQNLGFYDDESSAWRLVIDEVGNVGIGTTTLTEKLNIWGNIKACELILDVTQGCDYVFEDDYKLMTISELEKFITTNKHLPELATATEMEANGIGISEFNTILLKKIEELTLYIIEQNSRLENLESKLNTTNNEK